MSQRNFKTARISHYLPAAIILLGLALRLVRLGADSLWYDETVSAFLAAQPALDLIAHTARDIHPPGYYLLLRGWTLWSGDSEFALAFFSLSFGLLLIPLTYRLARDLIRQRTVALWAALLVALSPYHIWYSQEVRMYTLGACLGLAGVWSLVWAWRTGRLLFWGSYVIFAAIGLYTLYYFAFLLISLTLFFMALALWPTPDWRRIRALLVADLTILFLYMPWLSIAWRQATAPPVPPWRTAQSLPAILLESWSVLSFGQSVRPDQVWPLLFLTLALFVWGLVYLKGHRFSLPPAPLLGVYTFAPLLLILLVSLITPLYHVRYLFTYAPPFYILLGAGITWLAERRARALAVIALIPLLGASLFSLYRFHTDPRYRADDFRAAVHFIEQQWRPGDVILTNAGYTYTAFVYYADHLEPERARLVPYPPPPAAGRPLLLQAGSVDGSPTLGWGDPRSDFYRMTAGETVAALERLADDYTRLWLLRVYDTVTDPDGLIRAWLAEHTTPLEDRGFAGESYLRVQGFLLNKPPTLGGETVYFEDGMALAGWNMPDRPWQPGQTIPLDLGWFTTAPPAVDYKMSLKLWSETGQLAAQGQDTWPVSSLYRATAWPTSRIIYQPATLTLPADLPAGQYWLNVELYHPASGQPLPRRDGRDPVVTLGPAVVE